MFSKDTQEPGKGCFRFLREDLLSSFARRDDEASKTKERSMTGSCRCLAAHAHRRNTGFLLFRPFSSRDRDPGLDFTAVISHPIEVPGPRGIPSRAEQLRKLKTKEPFDVLIIGGGATGSGCALDAASRSLNVACIERGDFASETSSRRAGAFVQLAEPPAEGKPAARAASGRRRPKDGAAARRRDGGTRSLRAVDEEAELPATPRRMEEWPEAGGAHVDI